MAHNKAFGASNEPRTCLWCGTRLAQVTEWNSESWEAVQRIELTETPCCGAEFVGSRLGTVHCAACGNDTTRYKRGRTKGIPTGRYGESGEGFFCRTRCGYQFAVALAKHGRRLKPKGAS